MSRCVNQLFFLFSCVVFLSSSCKERASEAVSSSKKRKQPMESAKNIEIIFSDSAKVQAKLKAVSLQRYPEKEEPYIEFSDGIEVLFYDKDMNISSRLTARHAVTYEKRKTMEARGNVIAVNEKGDQLATERLVWDEAKRKLFSDTSVKITTREETIFGTGFESNENFTQYKIFRIKGTIRRYAP